MLSNKPAVAKDRKRSARVGSAAVSCEPPIVSSFYARHSTIKEANEATSAEPE